MTKETNFAQRKPYYRVWGALTQPVSPESQSFYDAVLNADDIPKDGDKRGVMTSAGEFTTTVKADAEARLAEMQEFVDYTGHTFEFTLQEYLPE